MTKKRKGPGPIILFGSGEMSPTGRYIQESVLKKYAVSTPLQLGILETPTGFEVNAINAWPARMEQFYRVSLQNYKPDIHRIRAWAKEGKYSTNDDAITREIKDLDYLYCGAGSPTYTANNLKNTKAYEELVAFHTRGGILCLGSASVIAIGDYVLPVYEIFKAGHALHWEEGLHFFAQYNMKVVLIPHYNNQEGDDFDTTYCWMGKSRFENLRLLLPHDVCILGIDEQTACICDLQNETITVEGIGQAHILTKEKQSSFASGEVFSLSLLKA